MPNADYAISAVSIAGETSFIRLTFSNKTSAGFDVYCFDTEIVQTKTLHSWLLL